MKRKIFLYSEDLPYFPNFTIIQNVKYFASLRGIKLNLKDFDVMLKKSGFNDYGKKYSDLSKEMKQRVSLLELMIINPEIVLMDEPTLGLDPVGRADLISLITEIKNGSSDISGAIIASNDLDFIENFSTKIVFISNGNIVLQGDFKNVMRNLNNSYFVISIARLNMRRINEINSLKGAVISGSRMLIPKEHENVIKGFGITIEEVKPEDVFRAESYDR